MWRGVMFVAVLLAGCAGDATSVSTLQRLCAFQLGCAPDGSGAPVGECVAALQAAVEFGADGRTLQRLGCAQRARGCQSYFSCLAGGRHGPDYCNAHPGETCDGNTRVMCANLSEWGDPEDCAASGMTCVTVGMHAVCTTGAACAASMSTCDGDRHVTCDPATGMIQSVPCALEQPGTVCITLAGSSPAMAACAPDVQTCVAGSDHCEGNVLVACPADGRVRRVDCVQQVQGHCDVLTGVPSCFPDDPACTPHVPDTCGDHRLVSCIDGHLQGVDCGDLGLSQCGVNTVGVSTCLP